ncbi:DNA mismatch repair endonuclease MutL [Flammeovirgaceae bacterium SG7u.111]|nr:DNA mismatch repair endonuclease MutL [Flammeovirgaceae bacterium SG7u.132]WPO35795.1 DNA mismatch repair endonuclease MutL [Flammeovirgaceae bacterium SG7u.111]
MEDIINLLPESLANQIAAGEVVQRPSSAVKEMLENSLDAGATNIKLIVKNAGKTLIQVIDNGKGMSENDARMCFERHATSKIVKTDDLFSIHTFGFRGEALASIAAVAQVELRTKKEGDETGTKICIEGSTVISQEPDVCADGTSISVKNLFFNVPARRNFLKSNPVELKHIMDEFCRVALARPEVTMSMYQDDLITFDLKSGKLARRVVEIFGKNYEKSLITCQEGVPGLTIEGYVGKPESSKKSRGEQFFFVNGRFIKHPYFNHAIMSAFEGLLPEGYFPFYVLNITLDARKVDVNVHPTKTEVKFEDEKTIYALIRASIKQALAQQGAMPSLDFDLNVNYSRGIDLNSSFTQQDEKPSASPPPLRADSDAFRNQSNLQNWENLFPTAEPSAAGNTENPFFKEEPNEEEDQVQQQPVEIKFSSAANEIQPEEPDIPQTAKKKFIQLHRKYILTPVKSGIMLINQEASHQRILYERFMRSIDAKNGASQKLVFPVEIQLNAVELALINEVKEDMWALGFDYEEQEGNMLIVKGLPAEVNTGNEKDIIEDLLEQIRISQPGISLNIHQRLARALARRTSLKAGTRLDEVEMQSLIEQLFACAEPNYTPGGNKTVSIIYMDEIESLFLRS